MPAIKGELPVLENLLPAMSQERAAKPWGLLGSFIFLSVLGQYFFKAGMEGQSLALSWSALGSLLETLWQPWILAGLATYALSALCWLAILSKVDLSLAYPSISLGYVAVLLVVKWGFGETVTTLRWVGVGLIGLGLLAMYAPQLLPRGRYLWIGGLTLGALIVLWAAQGAPPGALSSPQRPLALIAAAIILGLVGQFLLKAGMSRPLNKERIHTIGQLLQGLDLPPLTRAGRALEQIVRLLLCPPICAGLAAYVLSTIFWLALLTKAPLSLLYPLLSVGYVIVLLVGWLFFKERVTPLRWYGVGLISLGIIAIYAENLVLAHPYWALASLVAFMLPPGRRQHKGGNA